MIGDIVWFFGGSTTVFGILLIISAFNYRHREDFSVPLCVFFVGSVLTALGWAL